jgi:hypothetical protein
MELRTKIDKPEANIDFSYSAPILLLGSCFAESIGEKLRDDRFKTDINPFGVLYNPSSVASAVRRLLSPEPFREEHLFGHAGMYHSFSHHSRFSAATVQECLEGINGRLASSSDGFRRLSRLVVTFGTAYVYRLKASGEVAANCHKLPDRFFERSRLSVDEITDEWRSLLLSVWEQVPQLKVLFTVSPVRHWKDGAHGNQLSKSILLLAIDRLQAEFPGRTAYFPAYEIVMDELRDYRFYAEDMFHPSPLAVDYIWECFSGTLLSASAKAIQAEWQSLKRAIDHKPFHPESEGYRNFLAQTLLKLEQLKAKYPTFDLTEEIGQFRSGLKQPYGI